MRERLERLQKKWKNMQSFVNRGETVRVGLDHQDFRWLLQQVEKYERYKKEVMQRVALDETGTTLYEVLYERMDEGFDALDKAIDHFGFVQDELQQAWMETEETTCTWKYIGEPEFAWETTCGNKNQFTFGGPEENRYEYCPYCRKHIKIEEDDHE